MDNLRPTVMLAYDARFVNPALDPINASNYHFPKKTPPREKIYAPKWEQERYRDYKTRPGTPMRHVLKAPSAPRGLSIFFQVPNGMDFAYRATVQWTVPKSTGQSNITHYLMSLDSGLTWAEVEGGGNITQTVLKGLKRGQEVTVLIRAVNVVGKGPWQKTSAVNKARQSHGDIQGIKTSQEEDRPLPVVKPRTQALRQTAEAVV